MRTLIELFTCDGGCWHVETSESKDASLCGFEKDEAISIARFSAKLLYDAGQDVVVVLHPFEELIVEYKQPTPEEMQEGLNALFG